MTLIDLDDPAFDLQNSDTLHIVLARRSSKRSRISGLIPYMFYSGKHFVLSCICDALGLIASDV